MGTAETDSQLGSNAAELQRLILQGRVLAPATRTILVAAGICSGMRVLDLGSGMGDVACVAAELVGSTGEVGDIHDTAPFGARATQHGRMGWVRTSALATATPRPWDNRIWRPPSFTPRSSRAASARVARGLLWRPRQRPPTRRRQMR